MATMTVRLIALADHEAWLRMRRDLWPDCPEDIHRHEMTLLQRGSPYAVVFLSEGPDGAPEGFVEVSIRPFAEGCHSGRVGYVEGWYVAPGSRRRGVGKTLLAAAEDWARAHGCLEMASDTDTDNLQSQAAHSRAGYAEVGRMVHFRKDLRAARPGE